VTVDAGLLASDRTARADALDISRSFIVQAPAGSGKTELLIQRYLCLLATAQEPEEVVAITFTRKAAAEMQLRVVAALDRAQRGDEGSAAHEKTTLSAARAILARDAERNWHLRESPRRMRIQTLDAFCASITRMLPISSGLGGAMSTVADADMQRLYREAAVASLDWLPGDDSRAVALQRVLQHLDNNVPAYVEYLAGMLMKRDQWLELTGIGGGDNPDTVRAALEAVIEQQVCAHLALINAQFQQVGTAEHRQLLRYAGENLERSGTGTHPLCSLADSAWPASQATDVVTWRAIANALLKADGDIRISVDVRDGFPKEGKAEKDTFKAWLQELQDVPGLREQLQTISQLPDTRYRDEQWQVMLALFEVLPLAVAELRRLFAERGMNDHVEVAQAARTALGSTDDPGELAMLMDYRIRHLLVDEMQDTSIGQYRLLSQLTAGWEPGDGRTLFCVGDPMQSIYRFRDAEVGQFIAARQHGIGEMPLESLVLRQNFRSGEVLVDWFNRTFATVLPRTDDIATGAISYSPSVAVAERTGQGKVTVYPLIDAGPEDEARCSADVIEQCLQQDDGTRVAVLVRSRTQLPDLLADLRRRQIPCEAIEIDRLTDLPEIVDLLALTRALSHDGDRLAWLALLRAPWVGLCWADIHALVRNDRDSTVFEFANDKERLATLSADGRRRLQGFLERLQAVTRTHAARGLRERIECTWLSLGGAACLRDAEQLENAYRYFDALGNLEVGGTLADVAVLEQQLDEERVSSPGDAHTRVQVMTMHKAKGLQFDHVVLHGLGRTTGSGSKDVLAWLPVTAADGSGSLIISPLGARSELEKDPLHRFIEQSAKESERLELDRLLYVACTRAIHSLHLIGSVATVKKGSALGRPKKDSLLVRLWPILEADFTAAFAAHTGQAGTEAADDDEPVFVEPQIRRMAGAWQVPDLPAAPPAIVQFEPPVETTVDYYWVGSAARHAGTIVHRWLQKMAEGKVPGTAAPPNLEAVSRRWALALGVPGDELDLVIERVRNSLHAVLADERGRWLLTGEGFAELRLSGIARGKTVNVVIDRVRIDDGVHWLVDYKTSTHEGGDLAGFIAQEVARYQHQLRRYREIYSGFADEPVRTALYFPLLQEFVEVDPEHSPGQGD
jgi:ATP-dependent helicase/nuclease subunit A